MDTFIPTVAKRGAAVIAARGSSSAASAANGTIDHMATWIRGTAGDDWTSMARAERRQLRHREGAGVLVPRALQGPANYEIVQGLEISDAIGERIRTSEKELQDERDTVKDLLPG